MDPADVERTTAPHDRAPSGRDWLTLNRQQRQKVIRKKRRLVEEAKEVQRRPGSNAPATTSAEVAAFWQRKRGDIAEALSRAQITHPGQQRMHVEVLASSHAYQGGVNVAEAALWALRAVLRLHDVPGTLLHDLDALAAPRILLNAIEDAVAGKPVAFLALLPERETPQGGAAASTADLHRACAAAGVAGLWAKARLGGVTQEKAAEAVSEEFEKVGISITAGTAREFFKRVRRGADSTDVIDMYEKLTADLPASRPLTERKAWLKRLAETAGRILET